MYKTMLTLNTNGLYTFVHPTVKSVRRRVLPKNLMGTLEK